MVKNIEGNEHIANTNFFVEMCEAIDKTYSNRFYDEYNKISYVRVCIKMNIHDSDALKEFRAEAKEDDYYRAVSLMSSMAAMALASYSLVIALLPEMNADAGWIMSIVCLVAVIIMFMKFRAIFKFKSVLRWRGYILEVLNEPEFMDN